MADTTALDAYGTLLKIGDGEVSEAFTAIANVTNLNPPPISAEMYEATQHNGPGWDEYIPGLLRGGQVTLDLDFVPTESTHSYAAGLIKDMVDKTLRNFQLIFSDAGTTTWTFAAYVASFTPAAPTAGKLTAAATLQVTGEPTLA